MIPPPVFNVFVWEKETFFQKNGENFQSQIHFLSKIGCFCGQNKMKCRISLFFLKIGLIGLLRIIKMMILLYLKRDFRDPGIPKKISPASRFPFFKIPGKTETLDARTNTSILMLTLDERNSIACIVRVGIHPNAALLLIME